MFKITESIRKISDMASQIPGCIRFDIGQPDFDTPQHIKDAAVKALNEGFTGYTSTFGIPELRRAIAEKESEKNPVDPKNVLVTAGGIGALSCSILSILKPGDEVIVPDPFWSPYSAIIVNAHGKPIPLNYFDNERIDAEKIEKNVNKKTKAIIVNTPENPTGRVYKKRDLEEIVDIAVDKDLFLISDEVYEKLVFGNAKHISITSMVPDRTFLINSCSKTYAMTGWRIGWVIAKEEFIDEMMKCSRAMIACPTSIAQKAAVAALTGPQDCVERMRKEYEKRKDVAVKILKDIGLSFIEPEGAFYVFPKINRDAWKFSLGLLKDEKVSVVPGDEFGPSGIGCVRIALTVDTEKTKEGLERLGKYLMKKVS